MIQLGSFPGGLVLEGQKERSTQLPIRSAPLSKVLTLPLQQHIGNAAVPIVKVGDTVLKGQRIAKAEGHVSVCLHAPSSGQITAIDDQPIPHPSGLSAPCISIETDGKDQWTTLNPIANYKDCSEHELRQLIRDSGIVGLGGAGFPSFIKLNPGIHHHVDTLIINGVECEPYISCDDMIMRERAQGILDGIAIMRHAIKAKRCIIAIEDNKPNAINAMQTALEKHSDSDGLDIIIVPTRYPAGSEKQLIQVITNKQVPNGGLPIDIGIVMHNVGTAYAIARAINFGEPLISRIVTITGNAVKNAGNLDVPFGTPIEDCLTFCETKWQMGYPIIQGGPMMGYPLPSANLPITKTANCILVGVEHAAPAEQAMPCIRCGDCATVCPVSLLPQQLYWHAKAKDLEKTVDYNLFDCIECGCCNYVCPSEIPLVQYFKFAKTETMNQQQETQKSDAARIRHENRQSRQELEKQEKALRQQQRKAALAASQAVKKADENQS
ncbi:MAG: electron transport complex subunit RsxC [Piscirickettsiaceae bacterium]|jgi:Na+-translocating ferredoxin:NAD+ oxidoreductase subunit C|nr:electron transport complex subunit RsxC [Piscirickettsiaceae bacterium]